MEYSTNFDSQTSGKQKSKKHMGKTLVHNLSFSIDTMSHNGRIPSRTLPISYLLAEFIRIKFNKFL